MADDFEFWDYEPDQNQLELEMKLPEPKVIAPVGEIKLSQKQQNTVAVIAYYLTIKDQTIDADAIYNQWPNSSDKVIAERAGKRPSINGIVQHLGTEAYRTAMAERGVEVGENPGGLTDRQGALLTILSNTASTAGINSRLKKAGVTWPEFNAWRRQRVFNEAYKKILGNSLQDAIEMADVQLAAMAQNGNLNGIKYLNEMVGRAPDDKKAVDAMEFAKVILETVQKHVKDPETIKAIAIDIEFASQAIRN